ncbi:MAG: 50S ribosomal protein L24 [Gemmatimonadota bacterium]
MTRKRLHVRRGDRVMVIAGNYKGATGQVREASPGTGRVVVDGVNVRKRHQPPSSQNPEGGIITFEAPIAASNVMLICPQCDEAVRVRTRRDPDGTVERLCKRCENPIPTAG